MSEEKISNKIDLVEAQRLNSSEESFKESYKPIAEDIGLILVGGDTAKNSNMVKENGEPVVDGADERMLGSDDKETLALKGIEVKFISSDQNKNGDAKIDIGNVEKTFTGMTKEELMKYANDPFWVRLRWILFILFWAVWIAMLLGAVAIIIYAPKCAAPTPLVWWKKGPLVTVSQDESAERLQEIKNFKAKGVIVELSPDETYLVDTPLIKERIMKLVSAYKAEDLHVVMDLTPNYVSESDATFQEALKSEQTDGDQFLSAFVTSDKLNNWMKIGGNESAWKKQGNRYFLSQITDKYDLQMSSEVAQQKLKNTLKTLMEFGVKGFRLNNAKHFLISSDRSNEERDSDKVGELATDYDYYSHRHTTNQPGLGDIIRIFAQFVHNETDGEGFLTIRDDAAERVENYVVNSSKVLGFDLPRAAFINKLQSSTDKNKVPKLIHSGFNVLNGTINIDTLWMQVPYNNSNSNLDPVAYNMFMSLLPGVKVGSLEELKAADVNSDSFKKLEEIRESPVFQFGTFDYLLSHNSTAFAYIRVKAGTPGYLVAINPTDSDVKADFSSPIIGDEVSVYMTSTNAMQQKTKVSASAIDLPMHSVGIYTFVPK